MRASSALCGRLWKAVWPGGRSRRTMRRPGSFSPAFCCALGSGLVPTRCGSTTSGDCASMVSLFQAGEAKVQEYVLWRRVAGGLAQQRQEEILTPELDKIRKQKKVEPELIRLAGSLERLPIPIKTELANLFIDAASNLARENKYCAPYLGALGHLLSRAPLYAGPETVVSPDLAERAYEALRPLNWAAPELTEMQTLFLRAARVVDSRNFDLPKAARYRIATQLENAGVSPQKTAKLKEFTPMGGAERISLHDESLPPGLILTESR